MVLAAGGYTPAGVTNTAELFDPTFASFAALAPMISPRWYHTATLLPTGKVLIAGGLTGLNSNTTTNTAELFDPASGTFTALAPPDLGTLNSYSRATPEWEGPDCRRLRGQPQRRHEHGGTVRADEVRNLLFAFSKYGSGIGSDAHQYFIQLTGVGNAQVITVSLSNVSDSIGNSSASVSVPMAVLEGDTTGNGFVNSSDIGATKSHSGEAVTAANFRTDVTANAFLNSSDISLVKSKSGTALP